MNFPNAISLDDLIELSQSAPLKGKHELEPQELVALAHKTIAELQDLAASLEECQSSSIDVYRMNNLFKARRLIKRAAMFLRASVHV